MLDVFIHYTYYGCLWSEHKWILAGAAAYAHIEMQAKYDAKNPLALKQLVGSGTKVKAFPRSVMDLAFKESMALYSDISAKNPNWKKVYADMATFRKDQVLWFQFTEMEFDRYMQSRLKSL